MVQEVSLLVAGRQRRYLLALPPGESPRPGWPSILALHGTGATARWADQETHWTRDWVRHGFMVIIPEALPPDPDRPPKFLTNPTRWADGARDSDGPEDVEFLLAVLDDVAQRTGHEPQVCVTGFSNGAGMAFRFAAVQAERVVALAPVAGHCWVESPRLARPIPTLYLIGTADPLIPREGGPVRLPWGDIIVDRPQVAETLERWARALGCDPQPTTEHVDDTLRIQHYPGPVLFRSMDLQGLGHHWPGGRGQLHPRIGGPATHPLNANAIIAEFFRREVGIPGGS